MGLVWSLPSRVAGIPLRRRRPAETVRPAVLLISAASAVVLLVRSLVG